MTVGQKDTIAYRVVRVSRSNKSFLPPHGIGYGLGETGIVLNRLLSVERNTPRQTVREVTGTIVEETAEFVTLAVAGRHKDGHRLKIRVSEIIRRNVQC